MLDVVGNLIVLFSGLFAIIQKDTITASLAGLSVSYALQVRVHVVILAVHVDCTVHV